MHGSDLEAYWKKRSYFCFHFDVNFLRVFDVFLDLFIMVYFIARSIDLYAVKCFICIYFV